MPTGWHGQGEAGVPAVVQRDENIIELAIRMRVVGNSIGAVAGTNKSLSICLCVSISVYEESFAGDTMCSIGGGRILVGQEHRGITLGMRFSGLNSP